MSNAPLRPRYADGGNYSPSIRQVFHISAMDSCVCMFFGLPNFRLLECLQGSFRCAVGFFRARRLRKVTASVTSIRREPTKYCPCNGWSWRTFGTTEGWSGQVAFRGYKQWGSVRGPRK